MSLPGKQAIYERVVMGLTLLVVMGFVVEGCTNKKGGKGPNVAGEATPKLRYIYDGAKGYFEKGAVATRSGEGSSLQFPASVRLTPSVPCKGQPGDRCHGASWENETWRSLGFEIADPHYFRYEFISTGEAGSATFTARAVAYDKAKKDYVVVERTGTVGPQMRVIGPSEATVRRIKSPKELTRAYNKAQFELDSCKKLKGVPRTDKKGNIVRKGKKPVLVAKKGARYCLQLWVKRCVDKGFNKAHRQTCKKAPKKLRALAPKDEDEDEE